MNSNFLKLRPLNRVNIAANWDSRAARRTPAHASRARILRRILSVYGHVFYYYAAENRASGPILGGVACFSTKYLVLVYTVELTGRELAHRTRAVLARGIS